MKTYIVWLGDGDSFTVEADGLIEAEEKATLRNQASGTWIDRIELYDDNIPWVNKLLTNDPL